MSAKAGALIRIACLVARSKGIRLVQGPWFEFEDEQVVACCAIGAVLLERGVTRAPDLSRPGYAQLACETLDVDPFWLYRFWMGYGQNFQIMLVHEKSETKEEISALGIQVWRDLNT